MRGVRWVLGNVLKAALSVACVLAYSSVAGVLAAAVAAAAGAYTRALFSSMKALFGRVLLSFSETNGSG
jgi:hypothetical protein